MKAYKFNRMVVANSNFRQEAQIIEPYLSFTPVHPSMVNPIALCCLG